MKKLIFICLLFILGCSSQPVKTVEDNSLKNKIIKKNVSKKKDYHKNKISDYFLDHSYEQEPRKFDLLFSKSDVSAANFLDDNRIIFGKTDGCIEIWNIIENKLEKTEFISDSPITKIYVDSKKNIIICGTENGQIIILKMHSYKILNNFKAHQLKINDIVITNNGKNLITCSDSFSLIDSKNNNGKYYINSEKNNIRVWDFYTGSLLKNLTFHTHNVSGLYFIPELQKLLSSSWDGKIAVWDSNNSSFLYSLHNKDSIKNGVGYYKNRIISSNTNGEIEIWDLRNRHLSHILKTDDDQITSLSIKDNYLLASYADNNIKIINIDKEKIISEFFYGNSIFIKDVGVDSKNKFIFAIDENNNIKIWKKRFQYRKRYFLTKQDIIIKKKLSIPEKTMLTGVEKKDTLEITWPRKYQFNTIPLSTIIPRKKLKKGYGVCVVEDSILYNTNFSVREKNFSKGNIFGEAYYFDNLDMIYVISKYRKGFIPIENLKISKKVNQKYKVTKYCFAYSNLDKKKKTYLKPGKRVNIIWILNSKNLGYAKNIGWVDLKNLSLY